MASKAAEFEMDINEHRLAAFLTHCQLFSSLIKKDISRIANWLDCFVFGFIPHAA